MPKQKILADGAVEKAKHIKVTDEFRARILGGELKSGDKLPSYSEVRALYGVHTNTMEKVLVRLEQEGLVERRRGAGVFVCAPKIERAVRKIHGTIGLSGDGFGCAGISNYWSHLMGGVRDAASRAGCNLLLLDAKICSGWEKTDGVLVCDWNDIKKPRKELPGLPLVSLMTPLKGIASATADDYNGMKIAVEHLVKLGHRKIAYLHNYRDHHIAWTRIAAYHESLEFAGIEPNENWMRLLRGGYVHGTDFTDQGRKYMKQWLDEDWNSLGCTALLCHNDETALGAIQAMQDAGLKVPDDISVVGFDGTEFCDLASPALTSIELPLREIGARGVELLLQQIAAEETTDEHQMLNVKLRKRQSTAAAALPRR